MGPTSPSETPKESVTEEPSFVLSRKIPNPLLASDPSVLVHTSLPPFPFTSKRVTFSSTFHLVKGDPFPPLFTPPSFSDSRPS